MSLIYGFLLLMLILVSLFMIMIILMQKARSDGGMGAALGGGAAESAFGAETSNILTRATIFCAVLFFTLTFGLYLMRQYEYHQSGRPVTGTLPAEFDDEAEMGENDSPLDFPDVEEFEEEEPVVTPEDVPVAEEPVVEDLMPDFEMDEETTAPEEESETNDVLPESPDFPSFDEGDEELDEERE